MGYVAYEQVIESESFGCFSWTKQKFCIMGYVAYEQVIESESFGCFILDKAKVVHHELWLL